MRAFGDREACCFDTLEEAEAFLLGGEGPGLSADIISSADGVITIPMEPPVESLNWIPFKLITPENAAPRRWSRWSANTRT